MATHPDPVPIAPANVRRTRPEQSGLAELLQFEAELRRRQSVAELCYQLANESRRIVDYDQLFVLRHALVGEGFHVATVSSLAAVDRNAPLIQAVEQAVAGSDRSAAGAIEPGEDPALENYPFQAWYWQPLLDREGRAFGGLLVARSEPLPENERVRLERIAETASHAWRALTADMPVRQIRKIGPRERRGLAVLLLVTALFPVRMSALAPVEVVPARPFFITAPFAGVIERIHVDPNASVRQGQPLLDFDDVKPRNELALATEKREVARARAERSTSATFGAAEESREIAITQAEFALADAEYAFARDVLARTRVTAPRAGMAIYSDRRDWEGRAVDLGEPIMQIADPAAVAFRIDLPAAEQMALEPGAEVKVWLDSQPLWAIDGLLERASFQARPTAEGVLAFAVTARPIHGTPRIGSRGTAKLYGRWVPLIYSVLRRPIAGLRQFVGL